MLRPRSSLGGLESNRVLGQTISHYRVVEKLGEGGMGVVYRAEDTKLDRPVALKFLPNHLLGDAEVRKRFEREAKAAAALDQSNVCTVYEIDESGGKTFIAMALVEGESLDKKIARGPLKLEETLGIAQQIAKGLEAAHKKQIVHRDIKPENIMIGVDGHVTIMDFGLAQLTQASRLTRPEQTMGTTAYMSPEQTEGSGTDHRTDIWSLGVVLYEMITGQQPFKGDYDKAVMYSILNEEPEHVTAVRTGSPVLLEEHVNKALAKSPDERYQNVGELAVDLKNLEKRLESGGARMTSVSSRVASAQPEPDERSGALERRLRLSWALTAAAALAALGFGLTAYPGSESAAPLRRFDIEPSVRLRPSSPAIRNVSISPDGRYIAFGAASAERKLWLHDLEQGLSRALEGTDGAASPFWSADSSLIGFSAEGELRKVPVSGRAATRVCSLPGRMSTVSGSWSPDGEIIAFSASVYGPLYQVPARGGEPNILLTPDDVEATSGGAKGLRSSAFLPSQAGNRVLLFGLGDVRNEEMFVQDLETGRREALGPGAKPVYSSSGHLIFQATPTRYDLWAAPFSLSELQVTGESFLVAEDGASPSVSDGGTMTYVESLLSGNQQLVWIDRQGRPVQSIGRPQQGAQNPELSPDDRSVVFVAGDGANLDVWRKDVDRGVGVRLSETPQREIYPVWSPDGRQLVFTSEPHGNYDIFLQPADGSAEPTPLVTTGADERSADWSRDERYILYSVTKALTGTDLWYLERAKGEPNWSAKPFLTGPEGPRSSEFSPDGRFVAYSSLDSVREELYVTRFPEGGRKWPVSADGGRWPRWSPTGKELFFVRDGAFVRGRGLDRLGIFVRPAHTAFRSSYIQQSWTECRLRRQLRRGGLRPAASSG